MSSCGTTPTGARLLCLSEIRSGRNDGAIRRGCAAGEWSRGVGPISLAASPGQRQMRERDNVEGCERRPECKCERAEGGNERHEPKLMMLFAT